MQITETLINYLKDSHLQLNSNVLLTDLNKIILADIFSFNDHYLNQPLNSELLDLIQDWKDKSYSNELSLILNNNPKKFIINDTTNYSAQMIFPIFHKDILQGLLLFFRTTGNYIKSSSKAPRTIKFFIEKMLEKNYLETV